MRDEMFIAEIYISPVKLVDNSAKFTMSIPTTWCVIDSVNHIAIDIESELQYQYVETFSGLYFLNSSYKLLKDNKRVAVFPLATLSIPPRILQKGKMIMQKLEDNKKFLDGNEAIPNELYLKIIENSYIDEEQRYDINKVNKQMRKVLKRGK